MSSNLKAYSKNCSNETSLFSELSEDNIDTIFSFNYDGNDLNLFGAKAVAYETVSGKVEVFFFSQGIGRVGNNVHHRDVFSAILKREWASQEFKSYKKVLEVIAELYPMDPPEVYTAAEKIFASESPDVARHFVDDVVKCGEWDDAFIPLLNLPDQLDNLSEIVKKRDNRTIEENKLFGWIFAAQGYQFSARKSKSKLILESADMDSSLTSLQKKHPSKANSDLYKKMNSKVLSLIPSNMRRFNTIELPDELKNS